MDCSPPLSSVHGILQARILEWVAMPSSMGSSQPRNWTRVSYVLLHGRQILYQNNHCLFLHFCSNNSKPILLPTPPLLPPPFTSLHGGLWNIVQRSVWRNSSRKRIPIFQKHNLYYTSLHKSFQNDPVKGWFWWKFLFYTLAYRSPLVCLLIEQTSQHSELDFFFFFVRLS